MLGDLLTQIRDHYIQLLETEIAGLRRAGRRVVPEYAMEQGGQIARDGRLAGTRCDALVIEGGEATPTFFPFESILGFEALEFDLNGLPFALAPFHWYGVDVTIAGDPGRITDALVSWYEGAFRSPADNWSEGLKHAVHDISELANGRGQVRCMIDLGTAPVESVYALFDELRLAGAARVEFGFHQ